MKKHYNIPVFIPHAGCPFQCLYCNQNKIAAQNSAPHPEHLTYLIEPALQTIPAHADIEIAFFGGNFTSLSAGLQSEYLNATAPYLSSGRVAGIRISTRPDAIFTSILDNLARSGVTTIELGVQSLHDEVLKASSRGYYAEDVFTACELIRQYNFKLGIQLMIGLPGSTRYHELYSTQNTIKINPDMVRIYPTLVIEDTGLHHMYLRNTYQPLSLDEAVETVLQMYIQFQIAHIPVIRMGLHPGEELRQPGNIVAGPFHPAFGELVEQALFKRQAEPLLLWHKEAGHAPGKVKLYVNPRDISKLVGNKRGNIDWWQSTFELNDITPVGYDRLNRNEIGISAADDDSPLKTITREEFLSRVNTGQ
ncbi:MAG: radical SAM protein [Syntrophomonadaceae bacterium]|nr:radical SAM protein [Syntrophomonadaceae bacterium]